MRAIPVMLLSVLLAASSAAGRGVDLGEAALAVPEEVTPKIANSMRLFPISENRKYGFMDAAGKTVIEPRFTAIRRFHEGLAAVRVDKKWGFINEKGETVIEPRFFEVKPFSEGRAGVQVGGRWGFIDREGKIAVEPSYRSVREFHRGLARVKLPEEPRYRSVRELRLARARGDFREPEVWRYGYVGRNGEVVVKPRESGLEDPLHVANAIGDGPVSRRLTPEQRATLRRVYARLMELDSDRALIWFGGRYTRYGYIDGKGDVAIPLRFDRAQSFSEGLAAVHVSGKGWGYINPEGEFVVEPRFTGDVHPFSDGLARIYDGKAGYSFIDKQGKVVLKVGHGGVSCFRDGLASGLVGGRRRYIDRTGAVVWERKK